MSFRRVQTALMSIGLLVAPQPTLAGSDSLQIDCVPSDSTIARTPTEEMIKWISESAKAWNPKNSFSVGGAGALGRLFAHDGRLIHPSELAVSISRSPNFAGKKKKSITLGFTDSELGGKDSYVSQLSKLLGIRADGCMSEAYFMPNGAMLCGRNPIFMLEKTKELGRSMPAGYSLGNVGPVMLFCPKGGVTAINPQKMLTTSVAYGLFVDEREALVERASTDPTAAFRLYQYYWLSVRDPKLSWVWLEKAANLGLDVAKFNLAYELFERGGQEDKVKAEALSAQLVEKGFSAPDLRRTYIEKAE